MTIIKKVFNKLKIFKTKKKSVKIKQKLDIFQNPKLSLFSKYLLLLKRFKLIDDHY